ncbi:MAG: efflux RND transporter permease subunit, partial [Pseudomonadota bacterium]|nr:efflux RND transporter permease subunit [Pseudomonadota bacterium]
MRATPSLSGGGIIRLFTRHPNAANLVMVLMLLLGIFSIARINTQFFPTIETKTVTIKVEWPGASAEDVEANILQVIEPEVRFVDGVDKTVSYAREGIGTISLEFDPSTDMQTATSDVDTAVKAISTLPDDAESPKVSRVAFFDRVASISISGTVPEATLRVYARRIRDDLIARGIDKVEFTGLRNAELQVEVPEAELRRLDLSVQDVSERIAGNSRDLPSGQTEGTIEKQLRTLAEYQRPESLSRVEIRSFASGEKVWLGDIADIRFGFEDGQTRGLAHGRPAIQLSIQRAPTADTLATAKILDDYLAELRPSLPPGVELRKYDVLADALVERIMLLVRNGVSGLILVIATLFLFLNARVALWVAAGIPVAMLATVAVMFALGQSINMITLFGLIMMLGIVVDDAIVVGEHTATRFAAGDSPFDAAEAGAGRMALPVMAAMTTTAVAFAPMFLIRDAMGQIMGVLPVIVIAVLIASMIECFLILPGHLAHSLMPRPPARWSYWRHLLFAFVFGALVLAVAGRLPAEGTPSALLSLAAQVNAMREQLPLLLFVVLLAAASLLAGALIEGLISLFRRRRAGG